MLIKTLSGKCQSSGLRLAAAEALHVTINCLVERSEGDGSGGGSGQAETSSSPPVGRRGACCSPLEVSLEEVLHLKSLPQVSWVPLLSIRTTCVPTTPFTGF